MRRIFISLQLLLLSLCSIAQTNTLYVCDAYGGVECYEISDIDSIRIASPSVGGIKIDLGLSVCWAAHNIGAKSPEEYGTYFSWYGYDIATEEWGDGWRMPTVDEGAELIERCTWDWETFNGVTGYKVTGPNGNSIFLPATGWGFSSPGNISTCIEGNYWLNTFCGYSGCDLQFHDTGRIFIDCGAVPSGFQTVRPVSDYCAEVADDGAEGEYQALVYLKNGAVEKMDIASVDSLLFRMESLPEMYHPEVTEGQLVDLGLSVKWAGWNIGATSPEEFGGYYSWGETAGKSEYTWETYGLCDGDGGSCHNVGDDIGGTMYDVASELWGNDWRMPTVYEMSELCNECSWEWVRYKGVYGHKVTAPNGNSIFLPAAGMRFNSTLSGCGQLGYYWSSTFLSAYDSFAYYMSLNSGNLDYGYGNRYYGYPVRAVYIGD